MTWSENSSAANPNWNLATQLTIYNFGPLILPCGCPFIVQVQQLQVVPFSHFPYELSLSFLISVKHILLLLVLSNVGASPQNLLIKQ